MSVTKPNTNKGIGGKAKNLRKLDEAGIRVPLWTVIPENVLLQQLPKENDRDQFLQRIDDVQVPEDVMRNLAVFFGEDHAVKSYAVRSSAIDEDGIKHSFAGQFETYLHVPFGEIEESIKKIWRSTASDRVITYREQNALPLQFGIGVIVQEMIEPDISGVAFGIDPLTGNSQTRVISSVYGLGEGIVSGDLNADVFQLSDGEITETIVDKSHALRRGENGNRVQKLPVPEEHRKLASLNHEQVREIGEILEKLENTLGNPQDIEFAYLDKKLYLLQTRPVTAIASEGKGEYILWDNSNIIESYPGITTPLTYSFITKMYEMVYRQLVSLMGVRHDEIEKHHEVFENTLGLVRGRVYYNLLSWYKMLAMLPGYSLNAEFMETMMGVKERFELKEDYQMSKGLARRRILAMIIRMIGLQRRLPSERKRFMKHLNSVMEEYGEMDFNSMSSTEIVEHYIRFEQTLLLEWKAPMINDFFAMIWFGVLKKKALELFPEEPNIHNDLLCGSQDIISVQPVHMSMQIAALIYKDADCRKLFENNSEDEILTELESGVFPEVKQAIDDYIVKFGNRCVGELKLETISYGQNPALFIKVIKSYVHQGITQPRLGNSMDEQLRTNAERKINERLSNKPLKKWWFNYILRKARDLVSNRENLRYERTRGFGMVREMFSALGVRLESDGYLKDPRDIFYMELDEVKSLTKNSFSEEFKENIARRKKEFEAYADQPMPEERFFTYGYNFSDEYIYSKEKLEPIEGDLNGIGCCPGRVQAKVRVVMDPTEVDSLNGDILVTSSTDPGWVTLFPTASAIIVERGSLLSHSAIVSREMGIPCIVGVTGLLRTLKTGDEVLMDGSTGEIQLIES